MTFVLSNKLNSMANFMNLCRLCTKQDEFSKDLLDKRNKNVLKLVQEFTQIVVYKHDHLPKKLCLSCEEKVITFELFVLNCHKAQETLEKIFSECSEDIIVKDENETSAHDATHSEVKPEVKVEMTAEDIVSVLNDDKGIGFNLLFEDNGYANDDDGNISDEISIAALKEIKKKHITEKTKSLKDLDALNQILTLGNFKVKDIVKFECVLCDESCKSWTSLSSHYVACHQSEPVVICMCGFEIKSKTVLYKHVTEHKEESKKLRNEDNKPDDINVKDYISFTCSQCTVECSSWYSLKAHCEEYHIDVVPVVMCRCGIILKSKSVMYKHVTDHLNPDSFSCDKCGKILHSLAALEKHKMRHIPKAERRFQCSSCDKIFNNKDCLKSHEKSHIPIEERKKYECEICDLKFTTRSSAASHKRVIHEKIKGFVCDLCGYACGTSGELRQHRAIHSDDKPFLCKKCPKTFKTYSNLKTHMDTHEDTAYECYICRRILNSRRTLRKHLLVHEDKCRHVCSYCNKAFKRRQTLKVHMYTHTGDKPLSCKWCSERFAYASTLRSHRLRCHPDKMAAQAHDYTHSYGSHTHAHPHRPIDENYIKNDGAVVSVSVPVAKNEVEVI